MFPHFVLDRAKPGTVVVDASGRRFLNESVSYHQFVERMLRHGAGEAWLIADHRALVKYGLGMVRPGGRGMARFLRDGYLVQAPTLEALAQRLNMEASSSCTRWTDQWLRADRHRRRLPARNDGLPAQPGDASVVPNPTLGAIQQAPFYAVRLQPGDIGASVGLVTDADARVLRGNAPIPGLYAAGNDMQSMMDGSYPGPGINLGPAIVFAFAAAQALKRDASSRVLFQRGHRAAPHARRQTMGSPTCY